MDWLLNLIREHPTTAALMAFYAASNAISALPSPAASGNQFYRWFFDFSHLLAGNISRIVATRYPQAAGSFTTGATAPEIK